jgi:hypothetical protein
VSSRMPLLYEAHGAQPHTAQERLPKSVALGYPTCFAYRRPVNVNFDLMLRVVSTAPRMVICRSAREARSNQWAATWGKERG